MLVDRYVQFDLDLSLNGNHVLNCPNCGHEHCRVVRNGVITGDRWDSSNRQVGWGSNITYTTVSIYATTVTSSDFSYIAWANTATVG